MENSGRTQSISQKSIACYNPDNLMLLQSDEGVILEISLMIVIHAPMRFYLSCYTRPYFGS
jgi:hypothetical protein